MTRQQTLAETVRQSRALLARYFKGFNDTNHTMQAPHLPNHLAWTLGHLALVMHNAARHFDGKDLPETDFIQGVHQTSDGRRYVSSMLGMKSQPIADAAKYPSCARCIEIFDHAIDRLAGSVESADDAKLDSVVPYGQMQISLWTAITRNVFHNGTHCGQIVDLRRALGLGNVIG